MQTRAGTLTGASAIAASLVGSTANSYWWIIPIALFALAAAMGGIVFVPNKGQSSEPQNVIDLAVGVQPVQLKHAIATAIVAEYEAQEPLLERQYRYTYWGVVCFLLAIAMVSILASLGTISDDLNLTNTPAPSTTSQTEHHDD